MDKPEQEHLSPDSSEKAFDIYGLRVLQALRRIIRTVDTHSRKLNSEYQITVPQLLCLHTLAENSSDLTQAQLAKLVNLSISTVNGILDRLEGKELILRQRDTSDRRKVTIFITDKGRQLIEAAPSLLQDDLAEALKKLPDLEMAAIAFSLERVVQLMEAERLDASPLLTISSITETNKGK